MNKRHMLPIMLVFVICVTCYAQGSGIHTEYMKGEKTTRVETSMLYVYNSTDQFVQLMLRSWYKGEKLTSRPPRWTSRYFLFRRIHSTKRTKIVL
jgi:hypothetical protein